eukprot:1583503-Rhodomonas_salina.1
MLSFQEAVMLIDAQKTQEFNETPVQQLRANHKETRHEKVVADIMQCNRAICCDPAETSLATHHDRMHRLAQRAEEDARSGRGETHCMVCLTKFNNSLSAAADTEQHKQPDQNTEQHKQQEQESGQQEQQASLVDARIPTQFTWRNIGSNCVLLTSSGTAPAPHSAAWQRLAQHLYAQGYALHYVNDSGHCQFDAIAHQFNLSSYELDLGALSVPTPRITWKHVRMKTARWMAVNADSDIAGNNSTLREYVDKLPWQQFVLAVATGDKPGSGVLWGGHDCEVIPGGGAASHEPPLMLGFHPEVHYQSVRFACQRAETASRSLPEAVGEVAAANHITEEEQVAAVATRQTEEAAVAMAQVAVQVAAQMAAVAAHPTVFPMVVVARNNRHKGREMLRPPSLGDGADGVQSSHLLCPLAMGDGVQTNADGAQSSAPSVQSSHPLHPRQFSRFNGNGALLVHMQSALPTGRQKRQTSRPGVPSWARVQQQCGSVSAPSQ